MGRMPIALFSSRAKAEPVRQRLVGSGIPAEICEGGILERFWFVAKDSSGARIEVPVEQFQPAEKRLLDWDAVEGLLHDSIRCPECRSRRVLYPQYARHSLLTNLALGIAAEVGLVERDYYCEDCHFTWPKEGTHPRRNRAHEAPFYFIEGVEQTTLPSQLNSPGGSAQEKKAA